MFLPYSVDVPMERIPIANWALIGVTAIISIVTMVSTWQRGLGGDLDVDPVTMRQIRDAEQRGEGDRPDIQLARLAAPRFVGALALFPKEFSIPQLVTYPFVDTSVVNLVISMIFLFVFGNAVNAKLGHAMFLGSYLLLAVISGVGWLLFGTTQPLFGAAAPIMGIVGVFVVLFPRNDVTVIVLWRSGGGFQIAAYWVVAVYILLSIVGTVQGSQGIAYIAQVTGAVFGILLGVSLVLTRVVQSSSSEENLLEVFGGKKATEPSIVKSTPRKKGTGR